MSNAVTATGILVQRALLASPTVFTTVGEVTKAAPPGFSRNKIESTTHNDGAESYILGIMRQKDGSFTINYVASDSMHAAILADIQANTKNQWQFLLPSGVKFAGPGYVQMFQLQEASVDAIQAADVAICWAGVVVQS